MADYTLGEAYANQGVYKNPQSSFGAFAQGLQTGELLKQRREAKDQKINEIISKSVQVDPSQFISPIYAKAKEETVSFIENAHKLRKQYGDKRFMYTPEFQQAKADYDFKISNWKEESARFKDAEKAAASGVGIVDPNYLKAGKSSNYNDWISYKNPLTGEAVDPATGRSNVNIVPTYDTQANLPKYFPKDSPSLYSKKGVIKRLGGGSNDFIQQYELDPEKVNKMSEIFVKDHPEVADAFLRTRQEEVTAIMQQMAKEAQDAGRTVTPQNLAKAAAIRLVEQDMYGRLEKIREEKVNVPEYKPSTGGSGNPYSTVGNPTAGTLTISTPTDQKGKVETGQVDVPLQFTITPKKPNVAASGNVFNLYTGYKVQGARVQEATYGDFKVVPVYKQGSKGTITGTEIVGRIIRPKDFEKAKKQGLVEYKVMGFGSYEEGSGDDRHTVSLYRPANEVIGAVIAGQTEADAAKMQENMAALNKKAAELNGQTSTGSATTQSGYSSITTLKDKSGKAVRAGVKNGKWYNIDTNQPL